MGAKKKAASEEIRHLRVDSDTLWVSAQTTSYTLKIMEAGLGHLEGTTKNEYWKI